jgi:hypothetical protein
MTGDLAARMRQRNKEKEITEQYRLRKASTAHFFQLPKWNHTKREYRTSTFPNSSWKGLFYFADNLDTSTTERIPSPEVLPSK